VDGNHHDELSTLRARDFCVASAQIEHKSLTWMNKTGDHAGSSIRGKTPIATERVINVPQQRTLSLDPAEH
jgi:hypothetical protein